MRALWRREGIVGAGPVHARQVMERDPKPPTVRRRPEDRENQDGEEKRPEVGVVARDAEVDDREHPTDRETVPEDREKPRVPGVAFVHEAAVRTSLEVTGPSVEEP